MALPDSPASKSAKGPDAEKLDGRMLKSFPCYGRSSTNLILTDTDISDLGGNKVSYKQSWRALKATRAHQGSEWRDLDRYATPEPASLSNPSPRMFSTPISGCSKGADLQPPEGLSSSSSLVLYHLKYVKLLKTTLP
jgi:hypothetical protein